MATVVKRGWQRRIGSVVAALMMVPAVVVATAQAASALALPAGFSFVNVPTGLSNELTNMVFLPDGSDTMLVLGKCGQVRRVAQDGTNAAVSFTPANTVNCEADRGLVGLALAPDFATSRQVWLSYNYKDGAGTAWGRVSRLTANSATAPTALTGETIVLDQIPSFSSTGASCDNSHTVGTLLFAPDGSLFVGDGDASSYCNVDNSALAAQDLTSPRGKILRVTTSGAGVPSNPFYESGNPTSWRSRVFAYGFRNPFRFSLKPGTSSTLYVGDVGWNTFEEVDIAKGGENFGWPCWEGPATFRNGYDALSQCQALYANPPANLKAPLHYWSHFNAAGDAAIGGVIYAGTTYPADYQGAYFFGDYAAGRLWSLRTDANDALVRAPEVNGFGTDVGAPVAFRSGPNSDIFFADIGSNNVERLRYAAGNRAPVATVATDRLAGSAPLTVAFDGSASFDLDDEPITYAWDFGDGATSTAQKPSHTFTGSRTYTVRLTVTDQLGATGTTTLTINTGNNPPVLTVNGPAPTTLFAVGDAVTVSASATDPEDGVLPVSAVMFQQIQHHCPTPNNCHLHPGAVTTAPADGTLRITVPDHGDDSFLEIVVTATDSAGATASRSLTIATEEHNLAVSSSPAGVSIVVNGTTSVANPVLKEVAGSQNRLIAPATSGNLTFLSWSDGGTAADRIVTMPKADLTLVARYNTKPTAVASGTPASGPAPLAVQFSGTGSSDPDAGDAIASYAWVFGDGTTGSGATQSHTYTANGSYTATLTVTDTRGATASASTTVSVGVTGTSIPAPWAGGWQVNTQAALSGSSLVLTPNVGLAAGSAFWRTAVPSANLSISFDATIDQGSGADGMTLALANAATTPATAVGAVGGGLGFAGIQGVAIALDTWQGAGEPSSNFLGVAPTSTGGVLTYSATTTNVPSFRNSTHHVDVVVVSGRITVKIDGTQRLDTTAAVPANVLVGFSAGTGGATDRHTITNFVATYGGAAPPPAAVLSVTPTALAFGTVAVGAAPSLTFAVANTGGSALTVTSVGAPAAPFTMTGAPAAGATIAAGQSVTVTVTLRPTQSGSWTGSIPIVTSAGSATVTLSGTTPAPGATLSVTPTVLAFGTVVQGATASLTFAVANTGGSALTVTSVGAPAAPFTMTGAPAAGATIAAGQSVTVTVTLRPTQSGSWTGSIPIVTSAGSATVALSGTTPAGGGGTAIPAPWAGGWRINSRAALSGSSLVMTPNVANVVGTAFWPTAVPTANLRASFDITIDQGNGADGATFILGNPAAGAGPTSVGGSGGALGAAGIPGVAVTFDTFDNGAADPSANFIGVARTGNGLAYDKTATNIPALRNATHHIDIAVVSGHLTVAIDRAAIIDSTVALPATAYVGFGGSTGGLTDRHMVTNVVLTA